MYRIESDRRPDGRPYIRVELPMMCDPLLDILESVASAIVRAVDPQSNWIYYNVACQSPCSPLAEPELDDEAKSPRAATPGLEKPTHLSTVKGENDEHGS